MDISTSIWIALLGLAIVLELFTRTFNFLAVAISFLTAALISWMGFGLLIQLGSLIMIGWFGFTYLYKTSTGKDLQEASESRHSELTDDGEDVYISHWNADATAAVMFKGRVWQAELAEGERALSGVYKVKGVNEGRLILKDPN